MHPNQANDLSVINIYSPEEPVYCPHEKNKLWCMHPKVYLPISESREVKCPYCSQIFRLVSSDEPNKTP